MTAEQAAGAPDAIVQVDLILLTHDGARFALRSEGGRLGCLSLAIRRAARAYSDLADLVKGLAETQLGVEISYLGLISDGAESAGRLVVAASVRVTPDALRDGTRISLLTYAEVEARRQDLPHSAHFASVRSWLEAESSSGGLGLAIQGAIEIGVQYLDTHLSEEGERIGWDVYLDGNSVGLLSTAEGILAHLHAGVNGDIVSRAVATLVAMRNTDGGWRVRSSLVGAHSNVSITESTCECLWALHEAGRSDAEQPVQEGIAWLEHQQRSDGGWPSSPNGAESLVFPTTSAVRVLAKFRRTEAVAKGIAWLRRAQRPDGGWGAKLPAAEPGAASAAAYTAYAVVALVAGRVPADDRAVTSGCDFLRTTFNPANNEPWEPVAFTALVDAATHARMDYRHFATPWAISALCCAGFDLTDPVVFQATWQLLRLQDAAGWWHCGLSAPADTPAWAIHDAIFALHTVQTASARNLQPAALHGYLQAEGHTMRRLAARLLAAEARLAVTRSRQSWWHTLWMSALTVCVLVLILAQLGLFKQFQSASGLHKALAVVITALVAAAGAVAPPVIAQEYTIRRNRAIDRARDSRG